MHILYLHQYFNTPSDTGGTRSWEFARTMVRSGHRVTMVTTDRRRREGSWLVTEEEGITVHRLPLPYSNRMGFRQRMAVFLRFALAAARHVRAMKPDVIYATSTPLTIALPAIFAKKRSGAPMVLEIRDLWPEIPVALGILKNRALIALARWLERTACRHADHIVALSPGMAEGIARLVPPEKPVSVIPNGADPAFFEAREEDAVRFRNSRTWLADRPLVVYAGTLGHINYTGFLASVAAEMSRLDPDVRFLLMGDGSEHEKVTGHARDLGVLDRSFFMEPPVPKEQLPAVLQAADVAVSLVIDHPVLWNNSANKVFEALASATPVMINYEGWQADFLREHGAGIVVPPANAREAATQLHRLLSDCSTLQKASEAARKLAWERFRREEQAREIVRIIEGPDCHRGHFNL